METYEIKNGRLIRCNIFSETMEIPDNVKEIGKYVFALNTTIKNIILPKCCTIIDKAAFFGCTELENISAEYVKSISESAFEECYKLENINVNSCLKSIGKYAFEKCYALNITGPDGCYAADYAYKNNIFFCPTGKEITENAKISVALIAKRKKAAEKIKPMLNLNMLILGGTGTGKSRFFVKPNLMMCNTSYVVTDPSAELVESCGKMLERMGYALKVFNIDNMEYSCNYNPFHYIRDFNGNVDENAVIKMINTFMMNTKGEGQGGEQFWEDCTRMLLSAVCFLLVETASEEQQNFSNVLDLIHKAKVIEGKEEEKSELDLMFDKRKEVSPNALSVQYYDEFKQAAGKTMQSILISTTTRLQCFKLEKVRNLTCTDNIELDTVGDRKTALFIIIPSTDNTYTFLAAMMYTQLFDSLYRRAISKFHGRLPYHVRFILDEFANTGKIPDFEKVLATCRKFEISAQIILQNLSQLKRLYEKSWEEIPGNCDTTIFLGGKDQTNNEYIMKELGKETIDTMNINKTKSKQGSTSYNDGIMGRELMTLDELATMPNNECLVLIRGLRPFRTNKYDIVNHPRYNMLKEANESRNSFYLDKEIHTAEEPEIIDLSEYIDDNSTIENESYNVTINLISSDSDIIVPISEINKDVSPEINSLFKDVSGIYSKTA